MFVTTPAQRTAWAEVKRLTVVPTALPRLDDNISYITQLDNVVLVFIVRLLQYRLPEREFDSAIVSFAAVVA